MLIWLIVLSIVLAICLGLEMLIIFGLIPGLRHVLADIIRREHRVLGTLNTIKGVIRFEEGIDLDAQNFQVEAETPNATDNQNQQ